MGAASFNWPLASSLMLLAIIWAVLWPVVMYFAVKDSPTVDKVDCGLPQQVVQKK